MRKVITESQKREIEKLATDHADALIAYGADLYRQGLIKGAIVASIGAVTAIVVSEITKVIKKSKTLEGES